MITDWDKVKGELDGFKECVNSDFVEKDPNIISATVTNTYIRLSQKAIELMANPTYVKIYFDEKGKRMLVHKIDDTDGYLVTCHRGQKYDVQNSIKCRKPVRLARSIIGVSETDNAQVEGKQSKAMYEAVVFDLSNAKFVRNKRAVNGD